MPASSLSRRFGMISCLFFSSLLCLAVVSQWWPYFDPSATPGRVIFCHVYPWKAEIFELIRLLLVGGFGIWWVSSRFRSSSFALFATVLNMRTFLARPKFASPRSLIVKTSTRNASGSAKPQLWWTRFIIILLSSFVSGVSMLGAIWHADHNGPKVVIGELLTLAQLSSATNQTLPPQIGERSNQAKRIANDYVGQSIELASAHPGKRPTLESLRAVYRSRVPYSVISLAIFGVVPAAVLAFSAVRAARKIRRRFRRLQSRISSAPEDTPIQFHTRSFVRTQAFVARRVSAYLEVALVLIIIYQIDSVSLSFAKSLGISGVLSEAGRVSTWTAHAVMGLCLPIVLVHGLRPYLKLLDSVWPKLPNREIEMPASEIVALQSLLSPINLGVQIIQRNLALLILVGIATIL